MGNENKMLLFYKLFGSKKTRRDYALKFKSFFDEIFLSDEIKSSLTETIYLDKFAIIYQENSYNINMDSYSNINKNILFLLVSCLDGDIKKHTEIIFHEKLHLIQKFFDEHSLNFSDLEQTVEIFSDENKKFFVDGRFKKIIEKIRNELPFSIAILFDISMGNINKSDGGIMTLEEYCEYTKTSLKDAIKISSNTKSLIIEKLKRKAIKNG